MKYFFITILCLSILQILPECSFAADDSIGINLEVAFCNYDSICDPEENTSACPSDCVLTPTPTTTPTSQGTGGGTTATRRVSVVEKVFEPLIDIFTHLPWFQDSTHNTACEGSGCVQTISDDTHDSVSSSYTRPELKRFNVVAQEGEDTVVFLWDRGTTVRVLRSADSFPKSAFEGGELIYEGSDGFFEDPFRNLGTTLYYALFVKKENGTYGNGQLILVKNAFVANPLASGSDLSVVSAIGLGILGALVAIFLVRLVLFLL